MILFVEFCDFQFGKMITCDDCHDYPPKKFIKKIKKLRREQNPFLVFRIMSHNWI